MADKVDVHEVIRVFEDCGAYVDDAASFPEHFKPGVVKRDQARYRKAVADVAELIEAATEVDRLSRDMTAWDDPSSVERAVLRQRVALATITGAAQ